MGDCSAFGAFMGSNAVFVDYIVATVQEVGRSFAFVDCGMRVVTFPVSFSSG